MMMLQGVTEKGCEAGKVQMSTSGSKRRAETGNAFPSFNMCSVVEFDNFSSLQYFPSICGVVSVCSWVAMCKMHVHLCRYY